MGEAQQGHQPGSSVTPMHQAVGAVAQRGGQVTGGQAGPKQKVSGATHQALEFYLSLLRQVLATLDERNMLG